MAVLFFMREQIWYIWQRSYDCGMKPEYGTLTTAE